MRFSCLWFVSLCLASLQLAHGARAQSSSSPKHVQKPAAAADSPLEAGSVSNGMYGNPALGFSCKIPAGWVLRTEEMNAREDEPEPEKSIAGQKESGPSSAEKGSRPAIDRAAEGDCPRAGCVLLAVFSRPPQASGEDINASIVIAAESAAAYPGLKEAAQYFGPLTEVAKAGGFSVALEPYEFPVGTKRLVRADFQKDVGTRVMRQSTLVMLARGYAVSFTFIGGTEDEVEELVGGLSFGTAGKSGR